jgi:hypothetical protein
VDRDPVRDLAVLRIAVGAGAWLTPNLAAKAFGMDPEGNPQASYMGRLFGIRDVALAAGTLNSTGEARNLWLRLGLVCDAGDALAAVIAGRNGTLPKASAALVFAPAIAAVAAGAIALRQPAAAPA